MPTIGRPPMGKPPVSRLPLSSLKRGDPVPPGSSFLFGNHPKSKTPQREGGPLSIRLVKSIVIHSELRRRVLGA